MRLIDADVLKTELEKLRDGWNYYGGEYESAMYQAYDISVDTVDEQPTVQPQTVTEFADKCKECGKIQNEFFNFDAPMVKKSDAVSREAVIKNIKWWFDKIELNPDILIDSIITLPSVKPKYTDEEIDKAQAIEQAYVDKMVELTVKETKRPKGKWIFREDMGHQYCCSECGCPKPFVNDYYYKKIIGCPYCLADMSGGADE